MRSVSLTLLLSLIAQTATLAQAPTREQKVRADKARVEAEGFWIYNDLDQAYAQARKTGKPLLVSLRCIPCEECVKLDDDLVDTDPIIRPLLEKYVCVRIVGTNGLDLKTFQYDTDQSFAMFMLNADKTIYGRFGTRSHRTDWIGDVSLEGMARALEGGLELHANYPANAQQLAGKRGQPLEFASPDQYPSLREQFDDRLHYEGDVVKSCIHCHQIGEARREFYWNQSKPIPEELLFPYPHPKAVGLILDPKQRASVSRVVADSPAQRAGFQVGDEILSLQNQPLLSMADVQWVLHQQPAEGGRVSAVVRRGERKLDVQLELPAGWRRLDDTTWRVASWGMRRIATGGMRLVPLSAEEKQELGIEGRMALRAANVGKYGPHGAAMRAGFQAEDVIIEFDGRDDLQREDALFAYVNEHHQPGDSVEVTFRRGKQIKRLSLPIQK